MLPTGGGTSTVVVHVTGQRGEGVGDVRIDMSATSGSLDAQQLTTPTVLPPPSTPPPPRPSANARPAAAVNAWSGCSDRGAAHHAE